MNAMLDDLTVMRHQAAVPGMAGMRSVNVELHAGDFFVSAFPGGDAAISIDSGNVAARFAGYSAADLRRMAAAMTAIAERMESVS